MAIPVALVLLLASASAFKVYSNYGDDYSEYKGEGEEGQEGEGGHWTGGESGHKGHGQGGLLSHHHYQAGAGSGAESGSKAGGHIKHQVTKGYQNYHHKDEVGKTTSYIDSYGDSGDHYGSHGAEGGWAHGTQGGAHRDHHVSGFSGQKGSAEKKFNQKKESTKKKDEYKGNIAELIYAKKPVYYSKQYQHQPNEYLHRFPHSFSFY